jgi:hypothetical protein
VLLAMLLPARLRRGRRLMPQVYFGLPAEDLEIVDYLAERDFDGNRSGVLRAAVAEYLTGRVDRQDLEVSVE